MLRNTMTVEDRRRPERSSDGCISVERSFADFQIDERSLLEILATADCGHSDYMSRFVSGHPEQNLRFAESLIRCDQPDAQPYRVLIYVCPECGDIGCGAYSVQIRRSCAEIIWEAFADENGYEEPCLITGVGPFVFSSAHYVRTFKGAFEI